MRPAGEGLQRRGVRTKYDEVWKLSEPVLRGEPVCMGKNQAVGISLSRHQG